MSASKRTVLITGCSDGGMGSALALAFHDAGLHVYATARNTSKMAQLKSAGIETLQLDINDETSIAKCASHIMDLDILVNNAGASLTMPIADVSIVEAKKLFDTNLWSQIAMIQAFLPKLLRSSKPIITNHTSIGVTTTMPFQATYNASKAALSMYTSTLRLELEPFGVAVVELRTGGVNTNFLNNVRAQQPKLPENSIYAPAREVVEATLRGDNLTDSPHMAYPAETWAKGVVSDLTKSKPPNYVWRGSSVWLAWTSTFLPLGSLDGFIKKLTKLDVVQQIIARKA